jgi:hypothetical protein
MVSGKHLMASIAVETGGKRECSVTSAVIILLWLESRSGIPASTLIKYRELHYFSTRPKP